MSPAGGLQVSDNKRESPPVSVVGAAVIDNNCGNGNNDNVAEAAPTPIDSPVEIVLLVPSLMVRTDPSLTVVREAASLTVVAVTITD
jgi:hypothetical protein